MEKNPLNAIRKLRERSRSLAGGETARKTKKSAAPGKAHAEEKHTRTAGKPKAERSAKTARPPKAEKPLKMEKPPKTEKHLKAEKHLKTENLPKAVRGNFYKCGDKTAHPHFVSWNPVGTPSPDFHRPEFFGELLLG